MRTVVKAAGRTTAWLYASAAGFSLHASADLTTGAVSVQNSTTASIKDLGNDFYEITASKAATGTGSVVFQFRLNSGSYAGDGSSGMYVAGISIVDLAAPTVELITSPFLSDASWTKDGATVSSVVLANSSLGALAEASAETLAGRIPVLLTEDSATSEHRIYRSSITHTSGRVYRAWARVKSNGRSKLKLYSAATGFAQDGTFDLSAGTATGTGAVITPLGNSEFLVEVTTTASATATTTQQIRMLSAAGAAPYAGDGASGMYVAEWGLDEDGVSIYYSNAASLATAATWTRGGVTVAESASGRFRSIEKRIDYLLDLIHNHPLSGRKVTFVGTSLVAGAMPTAFAAETQATVQALSSSGGALGVDARGSPHYGSGAVTALFSSINADADVIILDMLVNDVAASDVPIGTITDTTTATYYGALANFFSWCETNRPNAAIAVVVQTAASASYTPSDYRHGVANANGAYLEDFQNATRRICDYYGRPFIDPNRFGIGFLDMGDDTSDGLHWDASGASRVAKIYAQQTRDLCEAGWLDI